MSGLVIELPSQKEQTKFNLRRWKEVCADPVWQRWEGRIETDRNGTVLISPPANFDHCDYVSTIIALLSRLLKGGRAYPECPISTVDGVRSADVAWMSVRRKKALREVCLKGAPEICVEVLSPSNRRRTMAEKKALYFTAGATEVWYCDGKGRMTFFTDPMSTGMARSVFCPAFPSRIEPA